MKIRWGIDGKTGNPPFLQQVGQLFLFVPRGKGLQKRIEPIGMGAALRVRLPTGIIQLGWMILPYLEKNWPMAMGCKKGNVSILAAKEVGRCHMLVLASRSFHQFPFCRIGESDMFVDGKTGLNRGINVDSLSLLFSSPQRQHHSVGSVEAGVVVGLGLGRHARGQLRISADVQQSTHGGGHDVGRFKVGVRSGLSKT